MSVFCQLSLAFLNFSFFHVALIFLPLYFFFRFVWSNFLILYKFTYLSISCLSPSQNQIFFQFPRFSKPLPHYLLILLQFLYLHLYSLHYSNFITSIRICTIENGKIERENCNGEKGGKRKVWLNVPH